MSTVYIKKFKLLADSGKDYGWMAGIYHNQIGKTCWQVWNDSKFVIDYPIYYHHTGLIGWDRPERIPNYVKNQMHDLMGNISAEDKKS